MEKSKSIYIYIGTTAELIKLAPVIKRLKEKKVSFKIITSGQNDINFEEVRYLTGPIKPYINFSRKDNQPSSLRFLIWGFKTLFNSIIKLYSEFKYIDQRNSYLIVLGDTVSTLIGAILGKIYRLKVVHIEAGLRSFNIWEPFPEELTRIAVSYLADIHFCPNKWAILNIKNRGGVKINTAENTAYESFIAVFKKRTNSTFFRKISKHKFFILIIHRQEHMLYKKEIAKKYIDVITSFANQNLKCIFIQHNVTEKFLKNQNLVKKIKNNPNIVTVPRLPFPEFIKVISRSEFIATDGGGNQVEAYYLGKPCLVLRGCTELVEGLDKNVVLAKDSIENVKKFLENYLDLKQKSLVVKKMPSDIIVDYLSKSRYLNTKNQND